jgi:hypothetical protein
VTAACSSVPQPLISASLSLGPILQEAFVYGTKTGRSGLGSIYVWSAGNAGHLGDSCNYDGYANSPYTISVGAVDHLGNQAYYSEACASLMVVAPGSGIEVGITTTDLSGSAGLSVGDCTPNFV